MSRYVCFLYALLILTVAHAQEQRPVAAVTGVPTETPKAASSEVNKESVATLTKVEEVPVVPVVPSAVVPVVPSAVVPVVPSAVAEPLQNGSVPLSLETKSLSATDTANVSSIELAVKEDKPTPLLEDLQKENVMQAEKAKEALAQAADALKQVEALNARLQEKDQQIQNLTRKSEREAEVFSQQISQKDKELLMKSSQLREATAGLENVTNQLESLKNALSTAEDFITNISPYEVLEKNFHQAMQQLPKIAPALNSTYHALSSHAGTALRAMKVSMKGKVAKVPAIAHHASIISEIAAYLVFALPLVACCICVCSGRVKVNVNHLCVFGDVFFLGVSATLFMFSIVLDDGVYDPLSTVTSGDSSRGIYIAVAVVFCFTYIFHLYALMRSRDLTSLAQFLGVLFIGTHYYSKVWYYAMRAASTRMRSPWWYLIYAGIFLILSGLSFRRLSIQQQNELRRLLFAEQNMQIDIRYAREDDHKEDKGE